MADLADFLLARIAEDEAVARTAADTEGASRWATLPPGETPDIDANMGTLPHITRHDPARVLAECEAKRAIIAAYREGLWVDPGNRQECAAAVSAEPAASMMRALAAVYADHPDYRDEWRA